MSVISPPPQGDAPSENPPLTIDGQPTTTPAPTTGDGGRRSRPAWRRPAIIAVALVAVAAAGTAAVLVTDSGSSETTEPVQIRAVEAEQRDLVELTSIDGTLQYANATTVTATVAGSVTAIVDDGDTLERGDVVYEIDAEPTVVLYGHIPLYRPLAEGDTGDDVEILEANLASLGYHAEEDDGDEVDTGFTVDGVFDAATADAVIRWQDDLGVEETGTVDPTDVVVTLGPALASGIQVSVGSVVQAGSVVMELDVVGATEGFYSQHTGEIDLVATSGELASGQILYTVDGLPITAIVTDEEFGRDLSLGVEDGDDIAVLEEMLVSLGYDARGDLDVDDEFDELTVEAIEDWEEDLADEWEDVVVDGSVSLDEIIVVEPGLTITSVTDRDSDVTATGSELFTSSPAAGNRIVATAIDVADQEKLSEGSTVDVEFPDGSVVSGVVTQVATSSTKDPTDDSAEPQLAVEIALGSVPESAAGLNELDVEVLLVEDLAEGATVVPAAALVGTADGGFAVEVVTAGGTSFVAVDPGMFADGFVEVTGIEPGTAVVVP